MSNLKIGDIKDMNGLLICGGEGKTKNIGDFIQSVAQEQFFNRIDTFIERENLDKIESNEQIKLIMNGWFMSHPRHFPPSKVIDPLFVSFHISPVIEKSFFTTKTITYLKQYEPIGARDIGTMEILERHGIKSEFSGCLTLTLGTKYKTDIKTEEIIFVDPYFEYGWGNNYSSAIKFLSSSLYVLRYYNKIKKLKNKFVNEQIGFSKYSKSYDQWIRCASFYHSYSKLFDDDLLFNASYITHQAPQNCFKNDVEKMEYARQIIKRYASAKLVITSRLHCALPCLGVETPVIFVNADALVAGKRRCAGRFSGLIELLHTVKWNRHGFDINSKEILSIIHEKKIGRDIQIRNKDNYKKLRDNLIEKVHIWMIRNGEK